MDTSKLDIIWIVTCAGLVFLMQAGFTCLESGLTRSKNSINVAVKNIDTGLGPHNVAFEPQGKYALVTTKKENVATLLDTSSADPLKWDVITTDIDAGIQNNGVRWVPTPEALKAAMK